MHPQHRMYCITGTWKKGSGGHAYQFLLHSQKMWTLVLYCVLLMCCGLKRKDNKKCGSGRRLRRVSLSSLQSSLVPSTEGPGHKRGYTTKQPFPASSRRKQQRRQDNDCASLEEAKVVTIAKVAAYWDTRQLRKHRVFYSWPGMAANN